MSYMSRYMVRFELLVRQTLGPTLSLQTLYYIASLSCQTLLYITSVSCNFPFLDEQLLRHSFSYKIHSSTKVLFKIETPKPKLYSFLIISLLKNIVYCIGVIHWKYYSFVFISHMLVLFRNLD